MREKILTFVWELYGVGVGNASNNLTKNIVEFLQNQESEYTVRKGAGASCTLAQSSLAPPAG
jgi:hypothetical protein